MPPKGKKGAGKGGEGGGVGKGKGASGAVKKENSQDKKMNKKEADKKVNEGVRVMTKAEKESCERSKKKLFQQAMVLFQSALSLVENHADAMYNLAIAHLEVVYIKCGSDDCMSPEDILSHLTTPIDILSTVIVNDTSKRGETTGLAHRILANVYCRYREAVSLTMSNSFEKLFTSIRNHIIASVTILANHPDLDTLLFENCQLFHDMISSFMQESEGDLSTLSITVTNVLFLREQIDACLNTPQSSGIDMDIKLLDGAILIDTMTYFVSVLEVFASEEEMLSEHLGECTCMKNFISSSLSLHSSLVCFVPDDSEVQTVAGDLVQGAIELHDSLIAASKNGPGIDTVFRVGDCYCHDIDIHLCLIELILCRCIASLQNPTANNFLALGDDLKAGADLVESDLSSDSMSMLVDSIRELLVITDMGESGLSILLQKQQQNRLLNKNTGSRQEVISHTIDNGNMKQSYQLYQASKKYYEYALTITNSVPGECSLKKCEDDEDDEDDEPDNFSTIHYNLLCVLWKLKSMNVDGSHDDTMLFRDHFNKYIEYEIEKETVDEGFKCSGPATGDLAVANVLKDPELNGIEECAWFKDVLSLHGLNI
jgi:hypothetical protein